MSVVFYQTFVADMNTENWTTFQNILECLFHLFFKIRSMFFVFYSRSCGVTILTLIGKRLKCIQNFVNNIITTTLNEKERITLMMMYCYADRVRPFHEVCNLFYAAIINRAPISKSTVFKTINRFQEVQLIVSAVREQNLPPTIISH